MTQRNVRSKRPMPIFSEMRREAEAVKAKWADRINKAING